MKSVGIIFTTKGFDTLEIFKYKYFMHKKFT